LTVLPAIFLNVAEEVAEDGAEVRGGVGGVEEAEA
jgi:hypothetical protein